MWGGLRGWACGGRGLGCLLEGTCVSSNAGNIVSVTFLAVGTDEAFYRGSCKQIWFFSFPHLLWQSHSSTLVLNTPCLINWGWLMFPCFTCTRRELCWYLRLCSCELGWVRKPAFPNGSVPLHNRGKGWSASVLILVAKEGCVSGTGLKLSSDLGHLCCHLWAERFQSMRWQGGALEIRSSHEEGV